MDTDKYRARNVQLTAFLSRIALLKITMYFNELDIHNGQGICKVSSRLKASQLLLIVLLVVYPCIENTSFLLPKRNPNFIDKNC